MVLIYPQFYVLQTSERLIPSPFQLVRNQAILRIRQIILFLCTMSGVACRLPFSFPHLQQLIILLTLLFCSQDRSFYRGGLYRTHNLRSDRLVHR